MQAPASTLAVYRDRRMALLAALGFSSGLPLALTAATLAIWLAESGVRPAAIGLFALAGLPYAVKFLWAPLIDALRVPLLDRWLGRRRAWALAAQGATAAGLLFMATLDPAREPWWVAAGALWVAFWSATQDIALDALRIEMLEPERYGAGAAVFVFGYRMGMLAAGAGALYIASSGGWSSAYAVMAALLGVGALAALLAPATRGGIERHEGDLGHAVRAAVIEPFREFIARQAWLPVLLLVLLYKLADAAAGVMAGPFYVAIGFSKIDIANVSKLFGLAATLAGAFVGGWLVARAGLWRSLFVCGVLQMLSNLAFVPLAWIGPDIGAAAVVIALENVSGGMGTAAFVAFLSGLCHRQYTATQYALLSSLAAVARQALAAPAGWFAESLGWPMFFAATTLLALPGLWLLLRLRAGRPFVTPATAGT